MTIIWVCVFAPYKSFVSNSSHKKLILWMARKKKSCPPPYSFLVGNCNHTSYSYDGGGSDIAYLLSSLSVLPDHTRYQCRPSPPPSFSQQLLANARPCVSALDLGLCFFPSRFFCRWCIARWLERRRSNLDLINEQVVVWMESIYRSSYLPDRLNACFVVVLYCVLVQLVALVQKKKQFKQKIIQCTSPLMISQPMLS